MSDSLMTRLGRLERQVAVAPGLVHAHRRELLAEPAVAALFAQPLVRQLLNRHSDKYPNLAALLTAADRPKERRR